MDQCENPNNCFPARSALRKHANNSWVTKDVEQAVQASIRKGCEFVHPIRQAVILLDDKLRDAGEVGKSYRARYDEDAFKRVILLSRTTRLLMAGTRAGWRSGLKS